MSGGDVEVVQTDRDRAASIAVTVELADLLRAGKLDAHPYVQAFARHRFASIASADMGNADRMLRRQLPGGAAMVGECGPLDNCQFESSVGSVAVPTVADGEGAATTNPSPKGDMRGGGVDD